MSMTAPMVWTMVPVDVVDMSVRLEEVIND
jgi:hypothetical protein